jgi:hypothetical protein
MHTKSVIPFLFLLLFSIQPIKSQQKSTTNSPPVVRDAQAVALLQRSYAAMGGENSTNIRSVLMIGQISEERGTKQITGNLTFKWGGPGNFRLDTAFDAYSHSEIVSGDRGAGIEDGESRRIPHHYLVNHPFKYIPIFSEVSVWSDPNYSISYLGQEQVNGKATYHIHVEQYLPGLDTKMAALWSKLSSTELYLDAASLFLVKRSQEVPFYQDMGSTFLLEQYFSGYKVQSGVSIPLQISVYVHGQGMSEIQFNSVQLNVGVGASDFEVQ